MKNYKRNSKGQFIDKRKDVRIAFAFILTSIIALTYPYAWALLEGEPIVYADEPITFIIEAIRTDIPSEYLGEMIRLSKKYDVPMEKMGRIIYAESSWRKDAENVNKNGTVDKHLCQINSKHWLPRVEKAGFEWNELEACFWIYSIAGDKPWYLSKVNWK